MKAAYRVAKMSADHRQCFFLFFSLFMWIVYLLKPKIVHCRQHIVFFFLVAVFFIRRRNKTIGIDSNWTYFLCVCVSSLMWKSFGIDIKMSYTLSLFLLFFCQYIYIYFVCHIHCNYIWLAERACEFVMNFHYISFQMKWRERRKKNQN